MLPPSPFAGTLTKRGLPLLLCINLALLLFYLTIVYQLLFHSDSAVKNLLAQEIVDTGQYFPRDWNFVNGDLWVLFTHTAIALMLTVLPNGFPLHAASDILTATLILGGSWLLTGMLQQSRNARLLSLCVIASGMSLIMAEHIFGQAAYGMTYAFACFLLYSYWSLSQSSGARAWLWGGITALLLTLVFWGNPQRGLIVYGLPLMAAGLAQQGCAWQTARAARQALSWRQARLLGLVLLACAAGVVLNRYTLLHTNTNQGLSLVQWLDFTDMVQHLLATVRGVLKLFDGLPLIDTKVASVFGVYQALRMVTALLLLLLLPWALYKALAPHGGARQLVLVFTAASLAISLVLLGSTSLADISSAEAQEGSVRYLVPTLLLMLLVLVSVVFERRAPSLPPLSPALRVAGMVAVLVLATSGPTSYLHFYAKHRKLPMHGLVVQTPDRQLLNFLEAEGLKYGYARFWNAGKMTVLSAGAVKIRQVGFERGLPMPSRNLASDRWYRAEAWQGESFLMLRDSELAGVDLNALAQLAGTPRTLRFQDWLIYVYPVNLAARLPSWDLTLHQPVHYPADAQALHVIGKVEGTPPALVAQAGEAGTLYFGPMREVKRGSYLVTFDIDASGAGDGSFGKLDVATNAGNTIHAQQEIMSAGRQRVTLRFNTEHPLGMLEFRVFSSGRGRLAMHGVDIVRAPSS